MEGMKVSEENNHQNNDDVAALATNVPSIFKLRADEFHGIFDLLTLEELIAVGKTCKRMQTYAGDFFQNYPRMMVVECNVRLRIFNKFISQIMIMSSDEDLFQFIGSNFKSLKEIKFFQLSLKPNQIRHLKPIMDQIEFIYLFNVNDDDDYNFLKMFPNLKRLSICGGSRAFILTGDEYPALEHLDYYPSDVNIVNGIGTFLEKNPNIRSFATRAEFLQNNQQAFKESHIELHDLIIHDKINSGMVSLLNELYSKKVFKRLHLDGPGKRFKFITKLDGLKRLTYVEFNIDNLHEFNLTTLSEIKEFSFIGSSLNDNMEKLSKNLVNLERIHLGECNYNQILSIIRYSKFMKKIHIVRYVDDVLDLTVWNEERRKVIERDSGSGINKLIIFLREECYLKFKWANIEADFDFIELRRKESCR